MLTALIGSIKGGESVFDHLISKYRKQPIILDILLPNKAIFKETGNNNAAKDTFDGDYPPRR